MKLSLTLYICICLIVACLCFYPPRNSTLEARSLVPTSLCAKDEKVIFSCPLMRSAKMVSLCSSPKLTKDAGYLQYRFGLPGKIELEFPDHRADSLKVFKYSHYFRDRKS